MKTIKSQLPYQNPKFRNKQFIFKKFLNYEDLKVEEDALYYVSNIINQFSTFTIFQTEFNQSNEENNQALLIVNQSRVLINNIKQQLDTWAQEKFIKSQCLNILQDKYFQLQKQDYDSNTITKTQFIQQNQQQFNSFKKENYIQTYNQVKKMDLNQPQSARMSSKYFLMKFFCPNSQESQFQINYQNGLEILSFVQGLLKKFNQDEFQLKDLYDQITAFLKRLPTQQKKNSLLKVKGLLI